MNQPIALITQLDRGWLIQWGDEVIACENGASLAVVVGECAAQSAQNTIPFLAPLTRPEPLTRPTPALVMLPDPEPAPPYTPALTPDEQLAHEYENLAKICRAWVEGKIDAPTWQAAITKMCPSISVEERNRMLRRIELEVYEGAKPAELKTLAPPEPAQPATRKLRRGSQPGQAKRRCTQAGCEYAGLFIVNDHQHVMKTPVQP